MLMGIGGRTISELALDHAVDVDARSGAAELRIPIPITAGRHGVGPLLTLTYGSGAGNSIVGAGWSLSGLPSISIDTRQRVPRWDGADPYALGGDELVPWLERSGGVWAARGRTTSDWSIAYYRSRRGGSRVRVEKWVNRTTGRIHFRSRDDSNTLTVYGARPTDAARIADPSNPDRTFVWLPELVVDAHGNAMWLDYAPEDLRGVDRTAPFEPLRPSLAQRYLKRIRYGNERPLEVEDALLGGALPVGLRWCFQVVLDYGDHADHGVPAIPTAEPDRDWPARKDAFTTSRAGFEVRTYRLCRRVLWFHDLPELGAGPTLIGSLEISHQEDIAGAIVREIRRHGYRRDGSRVTTKAVPPLRFTYAPSETGTAFETPPTATSLNVAGGLGGAVSVVDLYGEGLAGILCETDGAWFYKANRGGGRFGELTCVAERPVGMAGSHALGDLDADGDTDLSNAAGRMAGRFAFEREDARWSEFRAFSAFPHVEALGGRAQWVDLNGDGRPDVVIARDDALIWFASNGDEFEPPVEVPRPDQVNAPALGADPDLDVFFADMNGDGLPDLVRIQNGRIEYWPGLGNGRFGSGVVMDGAPRFAPDGEFDAARIRFVDLDGSGTSDLVYLGNGDVACWINAAGNAWLPGPRIVGLPRLDNLATVTVLDLLGDGRPCLVWSTALPGREHPISYLPLAPAVRPRLLVAVDDSMGQETRLTYGTSAAHYLRDQSSGRGWSTRLPHHHTVVDRRDVIDQIGGTRSVTRWEYHDGFYDGVDRESRGFGQVDAFDSAATDGTVPGPGAISFSAPALVRTWFHLGTPMWNHHRPVDTYDGDPDLPWIAPHIVDDEGSLAPDEIDDGLRGLAGRVIRREVWSIDERGIRAAHPIEVHEVGFRLNRTQPGMGAHSPAFVTAAAEELSAVYEQSQGDPRVSHELTIDVDSYDAPRRSVSIAYPRRNTQTADADAQRRQSLIVEDVGLIHIDQDARFELGIPIESTSFELVGLRPDASGRIAPSALRTAAVNSALATPGPNEIDLVDDPQLGPRARLLSRERSYYWNAPRTDVEPLGHVGPVTLVHHEEAACFTPALVSDLYGTRVDGARLTALGYRFDAGLWWQVDATHEFSADTSFSQPLGTLRGDGARVSVEYDSHQLATVASIDALGNRVEHRHDYHLLAPFRTTDPNGNIVEVAYDPLGVAIAQTQRGTVGQSAWGFDAIASWTSSTASRAADVLADVDGTLQGVAAAVWYDLESWQRDRTPVTVISLVRTELRHDGSGGGVANGATQISISYLDGFGRTLQEKVRVEPGDAIQRDGEERIIIDSGGRAVLAFSADRWRASGHVVYDNRQQAGLRYQPFFTPSAAYESDAILQQFGVATLTRYDAVGRVVGENLPNGTSTAISYRAWEIEHADANDTVLTSTYRALRENRPAGDAERAAWEHARAQAGTTRSVYLDPTGRACSTLDRGGTTAEDHRTEVRADVEGRVRERIDPRGLVAFRYRMDMVGRVLFDHSIDAGDVLGLHDAYDRIVTTWNPRGFETEHAHDLADRDLYTHVRGGDGQQPLDHRVEEWSYGEDLGDPINAAQRNLLGRVLRVRDGAGEAEVDQYDPSGRPLATTRRIRAGFGEPNWREATPLGDSFRASIAFDALGRPIADQLPDGTRRTFEYRVSGALDRVRLTTPDGGVSDVPLLDGTDHDARGACTSLRLGNGVELGYRYDDLTFRLREQTATRAGRSLQAITYTFDPSGSLVRLVDAAQEGPGAIIAGTIVPAQRDYTYDAHGRLRTATGRVHQALLEHDYIPAAGGTIKGTRHLSLANGAALERFTRTYSYDASGNLRSLQHAGSTRSWTTEMWISTASNRSLPKLTATGAPVVAPETHFDGGGNLRELSHLRVLEWNSRNALARAVVIERPGGVDDGEQYVYGSDGMRVRKLATRVVHGGQIEEIEKVYLGDQERKRVVRDGRVVLERWTTHVHDGDRRIAFVHRWVRDDLARETDSITTPRVHYQLTTHQGSSAIELDEAGGLISYEEYFPYGGSALIASDAARDVEVKEYRYSGKERDDATSLYYYGHRYLAPWIGRWLSPDPSGPEDDLNLYQFVLGDPVGNIDEEGLDTSVPGFAPGEIKYVNRTPPKAAATVEGRIASFRGALSKTYRKGFDTLSPADQERAVTSPGFLVPKDPRGTSNQPWAYISPTEYHKKWLPARQRWAKQHGTHLTVQLWSQNPNAVHSGGGGGGDGGHHKKDSASGGDQHGTKGKADVAAGGGGGKAKEGSGDGNKKKEGDGAGGDARTGDGDSHAKGDGRGSGDANAAKVAHERGHGGRGKGAGSGGTGVGPGRLHGAGTEPTDEYGDFGGQRGGTAGGVVGGTPWARGHTVGGMGTSLDDRAPLGGAGGANGSGNTGSTPSTDAGGGGGAGGGNTGGTASSGQSGTGGNGDSTGTTAGSGPSTGSDSARGQGPGGAKQGGPSGRQGKEGAGSYGWKNVLMDVAAIMTFTSTEGDPNGREGGIPGGMGLLGVHGEVIQWLWIGLSIIDAILMIFGIGEMIEGLVALVRGLGRLGWKLLTSLPKLIRLGWRGVRGALRALPGMFRGVWRSLRAVFKGRQAAKTIDPLVDSHMLINAHKAWKGSKNPVHQAALALLKNTKYEWLISPTVWKEFTRVPKGAASTRRFIRYLEGFKNTKVISGAQAKAWHGTTKFKDAMTELRALANKITPGLGNRAGTAAKVPKSYFNDIVQTAFARASGIPYVPDTKFYKVISQQAKAYLADLFVP